MALRPLEPKSCSLFGLAWRTVTFQGLTALDPRLPVAHRGGTFAPPFAPGLLCRFAPSQASTLENSA